MLPDFPQTDGQGVDDEVVKLLTTFRASTGGDEFEWDMDTATRKYQEWLLSNYVRPGMSEQEYLQVSIERSVGNEKVIFTLGAQFSIGSGAGRSISYDRLTDAINIEFDRYIRDRMSKQTNPENPYPNGTGQTSVWVDADRLNVEVKSGKRYFKVICGQWTQHGVNYWPETIKAAGVNPSQIPLEGYSLVGYKAHVELVDGKPKRILQLKKDG